MSPHVLFPGPDVPLSERDWQSEVIEIAGAGGWRHYHTHDSRKSAKGFPDLVLVRERVLYVELKSEDGKLRPEQGPWLEALAAAGQEVYIWRPSNRPVVDRVLLTPRGSWVRPETSAIWEAIHAEVQGQAGAGRGAARPARRGAAGRGPRARG